MMSKGRKAYLKFKRNNPLGYKIRNLQSSLTKLGIKLSKKDTQDWLESTPICYLCDEDLEIKDASIDHIVPISRGGSKKDFFNIELAHLSCNRMKGNMLNNEYGKLADFLELNPDIKPIIEQRLKASGFMYKR